MRSDTGTILGHLVVGKWLGFTLGCFTFIAAYAGSQGRDQERPFIGEDS